MSQTFVHDPQALLDYSVDWGAWLDGDTIATSTWATWSGLSIASSPAPSHTATIATVWLSGGVVGKSYKVTNHIVTAAGREDDRTITVEIRER